MRQQKILQEEFEKQITRHVDENKVTIINSSYCEKIPVYLAQAGYKVIVTGSRHTLSTHQRWQKVTQEFEKIKSFYDVMPIPKNYQIIFQSYDSTLIELILRSRNTDTVLIVEDSYNCINADLLFAFSKHLIINGYKLKLVILNKISMYNSKLSDFFEGAPVIESPAKPFPVSFYQHTSNESIEKTIFTLLQSNSYNRMLVFLPGIKEIEALNEKLQNYIKEHKLDTEVVCIHSKLPYQVQKANLAKHYSSRIVLSTDVPQIISAYLDIDVIIDAGIEKRVKTFNGIDTTIIRHISKETIRQRQALAGKISFGSYYLCSNVDMDARKEIHTEMESTIDNMLLALINNDINVLSFKFLHSKSKHKIHCSLRLLKILGALNSDLQTTSIGKQMVTLPMSVRFSRIFIESQAYGLEFDSLICYVLFNNNADNQISGDYDSELSNKMNSDLLMQIHIFKEKYLQKKTSFVIKNNNLSWFQKTALLLDKLCNLLEITPTADTDISKLKKCICSGFPDGLFVLTEKSKYKNNGSDSVYARLFLRSTLINKENMYVVGLPIDYIDKTSNHKIIKRYISLPTAYTEEDVIECYSKYLKISHSISNGNIFECQTYNGLIIKRAFLGTVEDLKVSNPDAFHQEKETDKISGETQICLYFNELKIDSKPFVKLV